MTRLIPAPIGLTIGFAAGVCLSRICWTQPGLAERYQ